MNRAALFSRASDDWETPPAVFDALDQEFGFEMDAAARLDNAKMQPCLTPEQDALVSDWYEAFFGGDREIARINRAAGVVAPICWLNPPYSRVRAFIAKAAEEAQKGCTVVCLVPARTDTRWWHDHVWDRDRHCPRHGVEVRFLKGRLRFVGAAHGAPFPSVIVVFRPAMP